MVEQGFHKAKVVGSTPTPSTILVSDRGCFRKFWELEALF